MDKNFSSAYLAKKFNLTLNGNPDRVINSFSSIESPKPDSLIFLSSGKLIKNSNIPDSCCLLVSDDLACSLGSDIDFLASSDIWQKYSEMTLFFKKKGFLNIYNPPSFKGSNVSIGENCYFGANVVLENNVSIGNNTIIGNNVVICENCIIKDNVFVDSGSVIGSEGFGNHRNDDGSWLHIHHMGKVIIHNNVSIGSNCSIDRGTIDDTIINKGVIIDNLVHIAHNVTIGENTAIAAKVGIAGSCKIGKRNMIGGMAGIIDHIKTSDDVIISATSTIINNIEEPGLYTGIMPTTKHSSWKRIAFWIKKLDKILKEFNIKKL